MEAQKTEIIEKWQTLFENWPEVIQRQGAIVVKNGESIPFCNFMVSCGLLLVERDGPDATGCRKIIVAYDEISLIKLSTAAEMSRFQSMGFQPPI